MHNYKSTVMVSAKIERPSFSVLGSGSHGHKQLELAGLWHECHEVRLDVSAHDTSGLRQSRVANTGAMVARLVVTALLVNLGWGWGWSVVNGDGTSCNCNESKQDSVVCNDTRTIWLVRKGTILTSDSELIDSTYMVTPTSTGGPEISDMPLYSYTA